MADIQFTVREFDRLTQEGVKGNAMSLDLDRFRRSGGKLIMWHGWDDQSIPATGTLDYYQRLWQHNGGLRATQEWARVFMVPTLYHCAFGGYRLNEFDPFPQLVDWVEHSQAPDRITANQRDTQGNVIRSRPCSPTRCGRSTTAPAVSTKRATSSPPVRCFRRTTRSSGSAPTCTPLPDRSRPEGYPCRHAGAVRSRLTAYAPQPR